MQKYAGGFLLRIRKIATMEVLPWKQKQLQQQLDEESKNVSRKHPEMKSKVEYRCAQEFFPDAAKKATKTRTCNKMERLNGKIVEMGASERTEELQTQTK